MRKTGLGFLALALIGAAPALADGTIKVGLLAPFSGPFADSGTQFARGIELYMREHGSTVAGKTIEIVKRDTGGSDAAVAKRLAQELVTRDKVDFLAGFIFTPEVLAVAPIATEAKTPLIVMNAATRILTEKSPYVVRFSYVQDAMVAKLGEWAAQNGIGKLYVAVSDFSAGQESEATFTRTFTAAGGTVVGASHIPLDNPEFAPYVQRIADAKPDAVYVFLPSGQPSGFIRQFVQLGLKRAGVKILGGTGIVDDTVKAALGDDTLGIITVMVYSEAHQSALNRKFVAEYRAAYGASTEPNYQAVGAYDGIAGIYMVVEKLGGAVDGDTAMTAFKGLAFESPRGPIEIDAASRDITEAVYIRRVERVDGALVNREIHDYPAVKVAH